jgi:hypothetical protein
MSIPDRAGSCIGLLKRPLHSSNNKAKMITNLVQEPETASKFDACIIVRPTPSLLLPAEPVSKTYAQVSNSKVQEEEEEDSHYGVSLPIRHSAHL